MAGIARGKHFLKVGHQLFPSFKGKAITCVKGSIRFRPQAAYANRNDLAALVFAGMDDQLICIAKHGTGFVREYLDTLRTDIQQQTQNAIRMRTVEHPDRDQTIIAGKLKELNTFGFTLFHIPISWSTHAITIGSACYGNVTGGSGGSTIHPVASGSAAR